MGQERASKMKEVIFKEPAGNWNEAIPIGNGRMGAMIFGSTARERIQLNEDSIWYGGPQERVNQDALANLPAVRELIFSGRIPEAEKLMSAAMSGTPCMERTYQSAGDLWIEWGDQEEEGEYERSLDLEEGVVRVRSGRMEREYIASFPGQLLVIHIKARERYKLSFALHFEREIFYDKAGRDGRDMVFLDGNTGEGGSRFRLQACVGITGGTKKALGGHLLVEETKEAFICVAMETSFYGKECYRECCRERLEKALERGWETLLQEHKQDYQELYHRMSFRLSGSEKETLSYAETYFQFGRYLCISASRPGSLPANLQGIWNERMNPPWQSKFTININTEMNYWPAEICNLSECHLPLFDLLERMRERGKKVARDMYGCRGFVAHHNTDIWGDCAPQDIYIPATWWVMGAAWLCTHIWNHYSFTEDREFLQRMYPVYKDAVLFFHDFLTEDKGELVTCPSVSPENTYILPDGVKGRVCAGASMDSQILRELFTGFLASSSVLGIADAFTVSTKEMLKELPVPEIGKYGQIMEWREDYEEEEPGHRHISQLYALHPSHQITPDKTPELAEAARKTLERRLGYGGGHTGWSCAWIVNLYARLGDGNNAWKNLKKLWEKSTFPNFMDNHPLGDGYVFQIDGNLGATAAMAELLLQNDGERILLLPALPQEWENGEVTGLAAHGGIEADLCWKEGRLSCARIRAKRKTETRLLWENREEKISLDAGEDLRIIGDKVYGGGQD